MKDVPVAQTTDLTRNGVSRLYVWTTGVEETNFLLYPQAGTAYPEFDERLQKQRNSRIYLYDPLD